MYGKTNYKKYSADSITKDTSIQEAVVLDTNKEKDKEDVKKIRSRLDSIREGKYLDVMNKNSLAAKRGAIIGFVGFAGYAVATKKNWLIYSVGGIIVGSVGGFFIGRAIEKKRAKDELTETKK